MSKFLKIIIWLVIITPAVYLAIIWNNLPDSVALDFDLSGNIDRYGSKNELITFTAILTVINVMVFLLLPQTHRIDPKKNSFENKTRLQHIAFAICVFISAVSCMLIYSSTNGNINFGIRFILAGAGLLLAVVGNYLYTIRPSYFAGIRLPWTLQDDENWKKTHLLGGKLFFAGGLFIAVICLFSSFLFSIIVLITTVVVIALITGIYSYRLYKKQKTVNSGR